MNCPGVFIRDIKSIFNQGQIALLPLTSKSQLPVLELAVKPVTLWLLPSLFSAKMEAERKVSPEIVQDDIQEVEKEKKPIQLPPTRDKIASQVDGSRLLFTSHT